MMGIRDAADQGRRDPDATRPWPATLASVRDAQLAVRLTRGLERDGWKVGWSSLPGGLWEARVGSPSIASPARARGLSRVSAITGAHLEAIRRAGRADARLPQPPGEDRSEDVRITPDPGSQRPHGHDQPTVMTRPIKSEFLDMNAFFDLV